MPSVIRTGVVLAGLMILAWSCAGCSALDRLAKPSARITGARLQDLSAVSANLLFDVEVQNPYSVPLPLVDLDYRLASSGAAFLTGQAPVSGTVPAGGSRTLQVPARVLFTELLRAVSSIRPGAVVPYSADFGLSVKPPAVERLRLDLNQSGEFPVPAVPEISLEKVDWKDLSLDKAGATLHVKVRNTNQFPFDLSRLGYSLALGNTPVADSAIEQALPFSPGAAQVVQVPITLSPKNLGMAVFQMLMGSGSGYSLKGNLDLQTPFGPVRMPYQQVGNTLFTR